MPSGEFLGERLPLNGQVLLLFIYHHKEMKETLSDATKSTSTSGEKQISQLRQRKIYVLVYRSCTNNTKFE